MAGTWFAIVGIAIGAILDRLHTVVMEYFITCSFANDQLLFGLDVHLTYLTNRSVYVILIAIFVDSQAEITLALCGGTVAFGEWGLKCVELIVKG